MSTTTEKSTAAVRPPTFAVAAPVLVLGVVVSAVLLFVLGVVGLAIGIVLTVVAVVVRVRTFGRDVESHVLAGLPLAAADGDDAANLRNLIEGLAVTAGIPTPTLWVLDVPTANLMVLGTSADTAVVVVTSGLLAKLDRIALEGVVARAVVAIRQGSVAGPTWAIELARSATTRPFAGSAGGADDPDRDVLLDRDAVGLTRYPPGLVAALEACSRVGTDVSVAPTGSAPLWFVDPTGGDRVRDALHHRIEALRLL